MPLTLVVILWNFFFFTLGLDISFFLKKKERFFFYIIINIVSPLPSTLPCSSFDDCKKFLTFFVDTVTAIKSSIHPGTQPPNPSSSVSPSVLDSFQPTSPQDMMDLITKRKKSSIPLDMIPPSLFLNVLPVSAPAISAIFNSSMSLGLVPSYFQHTTIQPILKKTNLESVLQNNYRPISKLPFCVFPVMQVIVVCSEYYLTSVQRLTQ